MVSNFYCCRHGGKIFAIYFPGSLLRVLPFRRFSSGTQRRPIKNEFQKKEQKKRNRNLMREKNKQRRKIGKKKQKKES